MRAKEELISLRQEKGRLQEPLAQQDELIAQMQQEIVRLAHRSSLLSPRLYAAQPTYAWA